MESTSRRRLGLSPLPKEAQFILGLGRGRAEVTFSDPEITWETKSQPLTRLLLNRGDLWRGSSADIHEVWLRSVCLKLFTAGTEVLPS